MRHLCISPGTALLPRQSFGKIWRVQNNGDCTWTPAYRLVFAQGEAISQNGFLEGPAGIPFPANVPPGATVDLRAGLVAPSRPGTYSGYWLLQAPDGMTFGVGLQGKEPLMAMSSAPPGIVFLSTV